MTVNKILLQFVEKETLAKVCNKIMFMDLTNKI